MGCYGLPLIVMIFCYAKIFINLASRAKSNSVIQRSDNSASIKLYEFTKKNKFNSLKVSEMNNSLKVEARDLISKTETPRFRSNSVMITILDRKAENSNLLSKTETSRFRSNSTLDTNTNRKGNIIFLNSKFSTIGLYNIYIL